MPASSPARSPAMRRRRDSSSWSSIAGPPRSNARWRARAWRHATSRTCRCRIETLAYKYDILEFNTAVKPTFLKTSCRGPRQGPLSRSRHPLLRRGGADPRGARRRRRGGHSARAASGARRQAAVGHRLPAQRHLQPRLHRRARRRPHRRLPRLVGGALPQLRLQRHRASAPSSTRSGSTWRRATSTSSPSCAIRAATWRTGTCMAARLPAPERTATPSTASRSSSSISAACATTRRRRCRATRRGTRRSRARRWPNCWPTTAPRSPPRAMRSCCASPTASAGSTTARRSPDRCGAPSCARASTRAVRSRAVRRCSARCARRHRTAPPGEGRRAEDLHDARFRPPGQAHRARQPHRPAGRARPRRRPHAAAAALRRLPDARVELSERPARPAVLVRARTRAAERIRRSRRGIDRDVGPILLCRGILAAASAFRGAGRLRYPIPLASLVVLAG